MMNKEKEMIERNIEISAEFSRYLFEPRPCANQPMRISFHLPVQVRQTGRSDDFLQIHHI